MKKTVKKLVPKKLVHARIKKESNIRHKIWHKFSNWLAKTYGKDLYTTNVVKEKNTKGKTVKHTYTHFNDFELSKRLVGWDVIQKIEKYIKRHCPQIKIVSCDDDHFSSSIILLAPHPHMGITMLFIPQNTSVQNQFFLYGNHYKVLMAELEKMKYVYSQKPFKHNL